MQLAFLFAATGFAGFNVGYAIGWLLDVSTTRRTGPERATESGASSPAGVSAGGDSLFDSLMSHESDVAFFSPNERVITAHKACAEMSHAV